MKLDTRAARAGGPEDARRRRRARARDLGAGRRGVHDRLAAAARRGPVRQARAVAQAARQDRLLDRRPRAAGDPRRAPDHRQDRALARADQARPDLPRAAARGDRPRRPPAHDAAADQHGDRAARLDQPEPAEHPDPHGDRPRDPRLLHRRARQRAALGRLLAGRAARARPHRRRGRAEGHLPARGGRPRRDRLGRVRRRARRHHRRRCARRPRWSTSGSSTASPRTGSPTGCGSRRRRRRSSSTATSSASRPSRGSSPSRSSRPRSTATSRRCSAAAGRCPEIRARNWQTRKLGERLAVNTIIQGTAADIIKVAMVRCHDKLRRGGAGDADDHADPRRAPVRGAGGRGRARPPRSSPPRWSAPPSSTRRSRSTPASGPNWLAAK